MGKPDMKVHGRLVNIITTHLKSGASAKDEQSRISRQVLGPALVQGHQVDAVQKPVNGGLAEWMQESAEESTILAMDANSRPQFEGDQTVWKVMTGLEGIQSVWADYFDNSAANCEPPPVSVNKCRGPGSKQPQKV